jgi:hypothetical protein
MPRDPPSRLPTDHQFGSDPPFMPHSAGRTSLSNLVMRPFGFIYFLRAAKHSGSKYYNSSADDDLSDSFVASWTSLGLSFIRGTETILRDIYMQGKHGLKEPKK